MKISFLNIQWSGARKRVHPKGKSSFCTLCPLLLRNKHKYWRVCLCVSLTYTNDLKDGVTSLLADKNVYLVNQWLFPLLGSTGNEWIHCCPVGRMVKSIFWVHLACKEREPETHTHTHMNSEGLGDIWGKVIFERENICILRECSPNGSIKEKF